MGDFTPNWNGPTIGEALISWCNNRATKSIRALPLIISWGIWLVRNKMIFQDSRIEPALVAAQSMGILAHFPQIDEQGAPKDCRGGGY